MGAALVFIGLSRLISTMGVVPAIIQKPELYRDDIWEAVAVSGIISLALTVALFGASGGLASLAGIAQVGPVLRVLSPVFLLQSVGAVGRGLLTRQMRINRLFWGETTTYLAGYGVLAVVLAALGFGVWSLVYGTLAYHALESATLVVFAWSRYPRRRNTERKYAILRFGSAVSLSAVLNYAANYVDYFLIGRFLTPRLLGLYTRAFNIMRLPLTNLTTAMSGVMLRVFSSAAGDTRRIIRAYLTVIELSSVLVFPILAIIAIASDTLLEALYGLKWIDSAEPLSILCVAGALRVVTHHAGVVAKAKERLLAEAGIQALFLLTVAVGVLITVQHGLIAVSWSIVVASLVFFVGMQVLASRALGVRISRIVGALRFSVPYVISTCLVVLTADSVLEHWGAQLHVVVRFGIIVILGFVSVSVTARMLPASIRGITWLWLLDNGGARIPDPMRKIIRWMARQDAIQ